NMDSRPPHTKTRCASSSPRCRTGTPSTHDSERTCCPTWRWRSPASGNSLSVVAIAGCSFFPVCVNECMSMLPVAFDRLRNTLQCLCLIKEISYDNGFIFQSLVILEEAFDFVHAMSRQFKN